MLLQIFNSIQFCFCFISFFFFRRVIYSLFSTSMTYIKYFWFCFVFFFRLFPLILFLFSSILLSFLFFLNFKERNNKIYFCFIFRKNIIFLTVCICIMFLVFRYWLLVLLVCYVFVFYTQFVHVHVFKNIRKTIIHILLYAQKSIY